MKFVQLTYDFDLHCDFAKVHVHLLGNVNNKAETGDQKQAAAFLFIDNIRNNLIASN